MKATVTIFLLACVTSFVHAQDLVYYDENDLLTTEPGKAYSYAMRKKNEVSTLDTTYYMATKKPRYIEIPDVEKGDYIRDYYYISGEPMASCAYKKYMLVYAAIHYPA